MMQTYQNLEIQEMPLSSPFFRKKVEVFLGANGLRMEEMNAYYTLQNTDGDILAGAGLSGDIIKGVAVSVAARSEGLLTPLLSHVIAQSGQFNLKVFTKPEYRVVFESLGFRELASVPEAILLENGRGLENYCTYLQGFRRSGRTGVVVMNANPFTLGHKYLLEQAAAQVDTLFVIPVKEEGQCFPYPERLEMIRSNAAEVSFAKNQIRSAAVDNSKVIVLEGSDYQISAATFPTYFLKDLSVASEIQMRLDLDLFVRHIAPALGATVRFVGSEPADALTARYNALMQSLLPAAGVQVQEIPRLSQRGVPISASAVRSALSAGRYADAAALTPATTHPYLLASLADRALRMELDTPFKPGLVGPDGPGAHSDMDYAMMQRSIAALRPVLSRMAMAADEAELHSLGIEAEQTMLAATGGVNTHRGAIFALGLALFARRMEGVDTEEDMQKDLGTIAQVVLCNQLIDSDLHSTPLSHGLAVVQQYGVQGARGLALSGYQPLFEDWLPYYRTVSSGFSAEASRTGDKAVSGAKNKDDAPQTALSPVLLTLLRIMSTLDDTCVIHRVGIERAQEVKREAARVLDRTMTEPESAGAFLREMCSRYAAEGISPGGAADMLALTILIDSII